MLPRGCDPSYFGCSVYHSRRVARELRDTVDASVATAVRDLQCLVLLSCLLLLGKELKSYCTRLLRQSEYVTVVSSRATVNKQLPMKSNASVRIELLFAMTTKK